jgi:hypothetical protein
MPASVTEPILLSEVILPVTLLLDKTFATDALIPVKVFAAFTQS